MEVLKIVGKGAVSARDYDCVIQQYNSIAGLCMSVVISLSVDTAPCSTLSSPSIFLLLYMKHDPPASCC